LCRIYVLKHSSSKLFHYYKECLSSDGNNSSSINKTNNYLSLHDKCLKTKSTTTHADENPDMGQAKNVAGKNRLIPYDPKSSKNLIFGSLTIIIIKRSCID
jgi:hypothetical protein